MPSLRAAFVLALASFASAIPLSAPHLPNTGVNAPQVPNTGVNTPKVPSVSVPPKLAARVPQGPNVPAVAVPQTPSVGTPQTPTVGAPQTPSGAPPTPSVPQTPSGAPQTPSVPQVPNVPVAVPSTGAIGCNCTSLPVIIADVQTKISYLHDHLTQIIGTDKVVAVDAVTPVLDELKVILAGALVDVKALVGLSVQEVLSTATGVLSLVSLCNVIATLMTLICTVLTLTVQVVGIANTSVVLAIVVEVGHILAELLAVIFGLVGGLQIALLPMLGPVLTILTNYGLVDVIKVINVPSA